MIGPKTKYKCHLSGDADAAPGSVESTIATRPHSGSLELNAVPITCQNKFAFLIFNSFSCVQF